MWAGTKLEGETPLLTGGLFEMPEGRQGTAHKKTTEGQAPGVGGWPFHKGQ